MRIKEKYILRDLIKQLKNKVLMIKYLIYNKIYKWNKTKCPFREKIDWINDNIFIMSINNFFKN